MWRQPAKFYAFHIIFEWFPKVIAIVAFALNDVWLNHERFTRFIVFEKFVKLVSHRDGSLLFVLGYERYGCFYMNVPELHVEPVGAGLDDLIFTKTCVKTAEEDEFEFVRRRPSDDIVTFLKGTEFLSSGFCILLELHPIC